MRCATARPMATLTCACSAATSSSTPTMPRCWCRCCRRWCTCAAPSGSPPWCSWFGEEAIERKARPRPRARTPRRGAAHRSAALDAGRGRACRACCAGWPMRGSRRRCGRCTANRRVPGRWPNSRRRRHCRVRRSSIASRAPSACRRWNICSPGAWPSRRICSAAQDVGLAEVAERVGYGSASTFSTAFSRHVGQPPSQFAREHQSARVN